MNTGSYSTQGVSRIKFNLLEFIMRKIERDQEKTDDRKEHIAKRCKGETPKLIVKIQRGLQPLLVRNPRFAAVGGDLLWRRDWMFLWIRHRPLSPTYRGVSAHSRGLPAHPHQALACVLAWYFNRKRSVPCFACGFCILGFLVLLPFDPVAPYARFLPSAVRVPDAFPSAVPAGCCCLLESVQTCGDVLLSSELLSALFLILEAYFWSYSLQSHSQSSRHFRSYTHGLRNGCIVLRSWDTFARGRVSTLRCHVCCRRRCSLYRPGLGKSCRFLRQVPLQPSDSVWALSFRDALFDGTFPWGWGLDPHWPVCWDSGRWGKTGGGYLLPSQGCGVQYRRPVTEVLQAYVMGPQDTQASVSIPVGNSWNVSPVIVGKRCAPGSPAGEPPLAWGAPAEPAERASCRSSGWIFSL